MNFGENLIEIHTFSLRKMHLKISFAKWWPFCLCLDMLMRLGACFNIKIPSYQYDNSYCGDKMIWWPAHLHNGISYMVRWHLHTESGPWSYSVRYDSLWYPYGNYMHKTTIPILPDKHTTTDAGAGMEVSWWKKCIISVPVSWFHNKNTSACTKDLDMAILYWWVSAWKT